MVETALDTTETAANKKHDRHDKPLAGKIKVLTNDDSLCLCSKSHQSTVCIDLRGVGSLRDSKGGVTGRVEVCRLSGIPS